MRMIGILGVGDGGWSFVVLTSIDLTIFFQFFFLGSWLWVGRGLGYAVLYFDEVMDATLPNSSLLCQVGGCLL